ncbi:MAG TPA: hypothetical protein VFE33_27120 [Thermoanaerobaculia bacterium]|nr:hypothetical protein [Thermoanaerobaculia bacterium]
MRLVTWNCCRGAHARKAPLLDPLAPDIAVLQECARPTDESETCLWFGDNPRQGIAVQAAAPYRLHRLPPRRGVPKYVVPVAVSGPLDFTVLAVWSKSNQTYNYVEAVVKAVRLYRGLIAASPTVLMGDLNSNTIWDASHKDDWSHSALVRHLADLGLVSAYHAFHGEAQGRETRPTYYFHWREEHPFHIDYCFIPEAWRKDVCRVEIGGFEEWRQHSDHRPLLVEVRQP